MSIVLRLKWKIGGSRCELRTDEWLR